MEKQYEILWAVVNVAELLQAAQEGLVDSDILFSMVDQDSLATCRKNNDGVWILMSAAIGRNFEWLTHRATELNIQHTTYTQIGVRELIATDPNWQSSEE